MKPTRLLPVTAVVVLLVALSSWWPGSAREPDAGLTAPLVPGGGGESSMSSTWFCAAGSADTPRPPKHSMILTNPSSEAVEARLTAYGPEGVAGSEVVEVPAEGINRLEVGERFGAEDLSVMVESASGELVVEHRLIAAAAADQVPCATTSSEQWYFPSQATSQVVDDAGNVEQTSATRLVLFNPFSQDAGVDITAAVDDGLRAPSEWAGIVVPAGTTRVIDVGEHIQRREQAALAVVSRNGRVVAETVQTVTDTGTGDERTHTTGVRMQLGVPDVASRWGFAMGFTGPGVSERLVVYNPSNEPASVLVQVTPLGGAAMPPEPFELEVPEQRYGVIDLGEEGRVPGVGHHSVQIESDADTPIVVGRVSDVTGAAEAPEDAAEATDAEVVPRPEIEDGTTIGTGSPVVATNWIVPLLIVGEGQDPAIAVHNPGSGIVVVSATALTTEGTVTVMDEVEVPAGDGVAVRLSEFDLEAGDVAVSLTSSSPVLVERTITFADQGDLSMGLAVPVRPGDGGSFPLISEL